jgi:hypothetical protein
MSTIKISELGNLSAITGNAFVPIVSNITGSYSTVKANIDQLKSYIVTDVNSEIVTINANVASANIGMKGYVDQGNTIQTAAIASSNIGMKGYVDSADTTLSSSITAANVGMKGYVDAVTTAWQANASSQASLIYAIQSNVAGLSNVASSGDYDDLTNTPVLSNVALSGDYNDLVANVPVLSNVAISNDYNDLDNLPNLAVFAEYIMGNVTHWTSNVFTFTAAIDQLAQRIYNIENP